MLTAAACKSNSSDNSGNKADASHPANSKITRDDSIDNNNPDTFSQTENKQNGASGYAAASNEGKAESADRAATQNGTEQNNNLQDNSAGSDNAQNTSATAKPNGSPTDKNDSKQDENNSKTDGNDNAGGLGKGNADMGSEIHN